MPNHNAVIDAVEDLLARGATDRLPREPSSPVPCPPFTDADVPEPPFQGRRGHGISAGDLRAAIAELAGFVAPMPFF